MIHVPSSARAALLVSGLVMCAGSSSAQSAYRVKDIATGAAVSSLGVSGMGAAADAVYFGTYSQDLAYAQLWRSDGTATGTQPLRDFGTLVTDTPSMFTSVPSGVFFFTGGSIWKIDASGAPVEIREIDAAPASQPVAIGDVVLFALGRGGSPDGELWRSDGTPEGTMRLLGATTGFLFPANAQLSSTGSHVFFSAYDDFEGWALWITDGTAAGTVRVLDLPNPPEAATVSGSGLFFFTTATDPNRTKFQVWRSDGTASGTFPVHDFVGESGGACPMSCPPYGPNNLTPVGNRVVFEGNDGVHGRQLWSTDGSQAGTAAIGSFDSMYAPAFLPAGERGYYVVANADGHYDLWMTDGTVTGTTRIPPAVPDATLTFPFAALGNRCIFQSGSFGSLALWVTDGTAAGTTKLTDTPSDGTYPYAFTSFQDSLLFVSSGELWHTDGTASGTVRIGANVTIGASSSPDLATDLGGRLLFFVRQPNDIPAPQTTLWISDGTDSGSQPLASFVRAAQGGLVLSGVTNFHGEAYFAADDGVHGTELWKTDGTAQGTRLAADVYPGGGSGNPYELVEVSDRLLFAAWDASAGGLWSTDGVTLERLSTSVPSGELFEPVILDGAIIYLAYDEIHGVVLWRSDGTPAGTYLIESLSSINKLAALGDRVYFSANDGNGYGLWASDGRLGGATLVRAFDAPFGYDIVAAGDFVYFTSDGTKLWRSDGTDEGTVQLVALSSVQQLTAVGHDVFFIGDGGTLWTSDGSTVGTHIVTSVPRVGEPNISTPALASVAGRLLFSASDGVHGYEPWVSDGTAAGTRMLADVAPGLPSSGPQGFTRSGALVYFSADDGATGRELWAIPVEALASTSRTPVQVERAAGSPRDLPARP